MKRIFVLAIALLALVLMLCSCSHSVETIYEATEGGRIVGKSTQNVDTVDGIATFEEVVAEADYGYKFVGWDDGLESATRTDSLSGNGKFVAIFEKIPTVKITYTALEGGAINGTEAQSLLQGEKTTSVEAIPSKGYYFEKWDDGIESAVRDDTALQDKEIKAIFKKIPYKMPVIEINTQGGVGVNSTSTLVGCTFSLSNTDDGSSVINLGAQIRGRGNSTWNMPKRSYKVKLDHPVSLFDFGKAKDWVLIANYCDKSLIRNYLAHSVALEFPELSETSKCQLVELYLNGEYLGVYLLCEQIEVGDNRIAIDESTANVDTGYLVELDGRGDGTCIWLDGRPYIVKYPRPETALTEAHKAFIQDYMSRCLIAMRTGTYEQVCALMNVESFAQAYIVFELFKCADVDWSSFYMHKDAGDKLECGPIWDFDISVGNIDYNDYAKPTESLYARQTSQWFRLLFTFDEFEKLVCDTLKEYAPKIQARLDDCYTYVYELPREAFERNFQKWNILGGYVWPNPPEIVQINSWTGQVEFTREYLKSGLNYLLEAYKQKTATPVAVFCLYCNSNSIFTRTSVRGKIYTYR